MKLTKLSNLLLAGLVLTVAVSSCRHPKPQTTPLPTKPSTTGEGQGLGQGEKYGEGAEGAHGIAANPPGSHEGWIPNPDVFQKDTVYFDYDRSAVKPGEASKVSAVADYLKANSSEAVNIEGHCDERGSTEYNLALGQRRANAVKQ